MTEALRTTGTTYTLTFAVLAVAFVFIPVLLAVSGPIRLPVSLLAIAGSALCAVAASFLWKRFSRLSIPSIAFQEHSTK